MHPSLPFKRQFNLQGPRAKQNITNDNETQTGTQALGKKKRRGAEEVHGGKFVQSLSAGAPSLVLSLHCSGLRVRSVSQQPLRPLIPKQNPTISLYTAITKATRLQFDK